MKIGSILFVFAVAAHLALLRAQNSTCSAGRFFSNGKCKDCPPGTYRASRTPNVCTKCPPGRFNPLRGAGAKRLCRLCPINTFARSPGSTVCTPCPKDTVADNGAARCQACGPGFQLRFTRCEKCNRGTYNNRTATLQCDSCDGTTSPRGATSINQCKPCPAGKFASFSAGCDLCIEGTFKPDNRRGFCENCPQGSVARPGAKRCTECPSGFFSGSLFQRKCKPCPAGFFSNGPGASRCRAIGSTSCPPGTFENANGDCDKCRVGQFQNVKTKMCERCPPGSVSRGGLQKTCKRCPPGQSTDEFYGGDCICPQGLFRTKNGKCSPCPPGTGGNFANVFGRDGCIECDPGTFSDKPGSLSCKPCPIGTISVEKGAKRCMPCPKGSTSATFNTFLDDITGANVCMSIRTGCPLGKVPGRNAFGQRACKVKFCQVGTPKKNIGISCTPCEAGFFLSDGRCKRCRFNEVSPGGVITSCTKCKNGLVQSFFDGSKCACDGDPGFGKGIQDGVCKKCPPGSASDGNMSECIPCQPGSFANEFGTGLCKKCPSGTFSAATGAASCKPCPNGTSPSAPRAATSCVPTTSRLLVAEGH